MQRWPRPRIGCSKSLPARPPVVSNLIRALAQGGYLVVGPSEGIYDMMEPLQRISHFLYKKVDGAQARSSDGLRGGAQR